MVLSTDDKMKEDSGEEEEEEMEEGEEDRGERMTSVDSDASMGYMNRMYLTKLQDGMLSSIDSLDSDGRFRRPMKVATSESSLGEGEFLDGSGDDTDPMMEQAVEYVATRLHRMGKVPIERLLDVYKNHADLVIKSIIGTGVFQFIEFLQRHPESFYIFPDGAVCLKDDVEKLTGDQEGPKELVKEPGYISYILTDTAVITTSESGKRVFFDLDAYSRQTGFDISDLSRVFRLDDVVVVDAQLTATELGQKWLASRVTKTGAIRKRNSSSLASDRRGNSSASSTDGAAAAAKPAPLHPVGKKNEAFSSSESVEEAPATLLSPPSSNLQSSRPVSAGGTTLKGAQGTVIRIRADGGLLLLRGRAAGAAATDAATGEDHAYFDRDVFVKSTGIETDDLREFLALGDILDVDAVPEEDPEPRNKYAKWKATSLLCGPADLDLEDIGATLVPMGYRDTSKTAAATAATVTPEEAAAQQQQQFLELQKQQKAQLQQQQKQQQQQQGRVSSYSESVVQAAEGDRVEEEEDDGGVDDRFSVSSPNLTRGGQHFIDSLTPGAKKTQSPKSPKSSSSVRGGDDDDDDPSTSGQEGLTDKSSSSGNVESGSYNTKSGRMHVKSPLVPQKQTQQQQSQQQQPQHPTAIVAPIMTASGTEVADADQTAPKMQQQHHHHVRGQGGVNPAYVDSDGDEVFVSDDTASSMQRLDINDGGCRR